MYFAWLGHYTTALIVPAAVGAIYWVKKNYTSICIKSTADLLIAMIVFFFLFEFNFSSCEFTQIGIIGRNQAVEDVAYVLFSVFNVIWATVYLETWKRRGAELAYRWGTLDQRDDLLVEPRPLFTVSLSTSAHLSPSFLKSHPSFIEFDCNAFYTLYLFIIFISLLFLSPSLEIYTGHVGNFTRDWKTGTNLSQMEEKHVPVLRQRSHHRRVFVLRFHRDDTQLPNTGSSYFFRLEIKNFFFALVCTFKFVKVLSNNISNVPRVIWQRARVCALAKLFLFRIKN